MRKESAIDEGISFTNASVVKRPTCNHAAFDISIIVFPHQDSDLSLSQRYKVYKRRKTPTFFDKETFFGEWEP